VKLAELEEGEFFGEVSLLTGKPRTATITSLDETEVLELTREDLEELEARHPRVRQVIKEFYERRVASTVEAMIQAVRSPKADSRG
jgi:cAMP-dependent protein kinase regulator